MNTLADTIRDELKRAKQNKPAVQTAKVWEYEPTNRECAAIPCIYMGVMEDCKAYIKPKNVECAAIPA
ncbi:MAG TPA: hypothetical protein HA362_04455 [Nanoarchaeota archaeon]|nr:hypothetical protein [Nanoarchaeota archaeon]